MAKYRNDKKSYSSLIIALLLLGSFALLFYRNLLTREQIKKGDNIKGLASVEELVQENAEKKTDSESFTFYSTLTKEPKKMDRTKQNEIAEKILEPEKKDERTNNHSTEEYIEKSAFKNVTEKDLDKKLYTVQLASFKEFDKADDLASSLKKKGYRAYILASNLDDDSVRFRVRAGKFADFNHAKQFSHDLNEREKFKSIVVRE